MRAKTLLTDGNLQFGAVWVSIAPTDWSAMSGCGHINEGTFISRLK
jgi:hypothetical protein